VEKVKELLESVKDNSQFLNSIKTKLNSDSLEKFISDKAASEVIKFTKRFEYDNSTGSEKETRTKKMRKHYGLGKNATLSDDQINEYCYEVAIGKIIESSINENEKESENTTNPENNILKYAGIGALILIPFGLALIFLLIRKRKRIEEE
jgi:Fe2+ transport system protein B